MRCKNCGHKNKKGAQYCIACGEPLSSSEGINKLIPILLVVIFLLAIGVGFIISNNDFSNNNAPIENVVNNTTETNDTQLDSSANDTEDNSDDEIEGQVKQSTPKTINELKSDVVEIYGVPFTVPEGGSFRTACTYQFSFNGNDCEVEEVEHYETSDSERTFNSWEPSNYYSGGEGYKLTVNNHVWKGIKVEKDNRWYHISMKSNDDDEVLKMLDWMYAKNSWVGH